MNLEKTWQAIPRLAPGVLILALIQVCAVARSAETGDSAPAPVPPGPARCCRAQRTGRLCTPVSRQESARQAPALELPAMSFQGSSTFLLSLSSARATAAAPFQGRDQRQEHIVTQILAGRPFCSNSRFTTAANSSSVLEAGKIDFREEIRGQHEAAVPVENERFQGTSSLGFAARCSRGIADSSIVRLLRTHYALKSVSPSRQRRMRPRLARTQLGIERGAAADSRTWYRNRRLGTACAARNRPCQLSEGLR